MKTKKKSWIILTYAACVIAAVVLLAAVFMPPEKRLLKKLEGEYKYTDVIACFDNGQSIFNNPVSHNQSEARLLARVSENIHISKEYVAIEDIEHNLQSSVRTYINPEFLYYKTSDKDLDTSVKNQLEELQKSLPDIDVYKGKCLIAKDGERPAVFLIYGDDIYTRSYGLRKPDGTVNQFYLKIEKVNEYSMTKAEEMLFSKLRGKYRAGEAVAFSRSYSDKENAQEQIHFSHIFRNDIHLEEDIVSFPYVLPDSENETVVIDAPYFTYHKSGEEDFSETIGADIAPFKEYVKENYEQVDFSECECLAVWDKDKIIKKGGLDSLQAFFISVDDDVYLFSAGNFIRLEKVR